MQKRKYQEIWEQLKQHSKCSVQVHRAVVARIVKAVIKEKFNDEAFRLANPHDNFRLGKKITILADKKHARIDFILKGTFGLTDLKSEIDL